MRHSHIPFSAIALSFVIALSVGLLTALLAHEAGPHDVVIPGISSDRLVGLQAAPPGEAKVSVDEIRDSYSPGFFGVSPVGRIDLGRFNDTAPEYPGRLVWIVTYVHLERAGPVSVSGSTDHSCDWAWHYAYVYSMVDAETGENIVHSWGAYFDASVPPTVPHPENIDHEYCKQLEERDFQQPSGTLQFP